MELFQSFFELLINFKYIPNANIEGTHNPMKLPSAFSPLKYSNSENTNDNKAATNKSLSAVVNFLNIFFYFNKFLSKNNIFLLIFLQLLTLFQLVSKIKI